MIGQTISHYRILEKIGEGGMGVVYEAYHHKLSSPATPEILSPDLTRDSEGG